MTDPVVTAADEIGKEPAVLVEIDLDYVTSATAAEDPDGARCYNTPSTSAYWAPLTVGIKTRRFCNRECRKMFGLDAIPSVVSAKWTDDALQLGKGLGNFGSVQITLQDHQDADRTEDPYWSSRSPVPSSGSFWRRLLKRNPYVYGRALRIKWGYRTDTYDATRWRTRTYLIQGITGPGADGSVTIQGVGPLAFSKLSNAQCPAPSEGTLLADMTTIATTFSLEDATMASAYGASGYVSIGDEVMSFTRASNVFTVTRACLDSLAEEHSAGDSVQLCVKWSADTLDQVLYDLLVTYGGVDAALIPTAAWASLEAEWFSVYAFDTLIGRPEKVMDLISELCEQTGSFLWWDAENALIQLAALRPALATSTRQWTDDDTLLAPLDPTIDLSERISRCDVLLGLRTPLADPEATESYRIRIVGAPHGEDVTEHGSPSRKVIYSRWFVPLQLSLARRIPYTITGQLRDGRQTWVARISAKDAADLSLNDTVEITSRDIVDTEGDPEPTLAIVVDIQADRIGHEYSVTLERSQFGGRWAWAMPDDDTEYDDATTKDPAGFACGTDGLMANGDPGYRAQ